MYKIYLKEVFAGFDSVIVADDFEFREGDGCIQINDYKGLALYIPVYNILAIYGLESEDEEEEEPEETVEEVNENQPSSRKGGLFTSLFGR